MGDEAATKDKRLRRPSGMSAFVKVDAKQKYKTYTFLSTNSKEAFPSADLCFRKGFYFISVH
ncbi:hypothetical protein ASG93_23795 [Paenibacillus sp. Soil787]|nr:hypothetical protein ASG93_23795 [Paenibacillus sp. Soil787]